MNDATNRPATKGVHHLGITLWQAEDPATATGFDRKRNIGLHHLALALADRAALNAMHDRLREAAGVTMEFAPEQVGANPFHHMMCTIPGGVRLEFIAPS